MSKFAFIRPSWYPYWAGDLKAIQDLQEGLEQLGHTTLLTKQPLDALQADFPFFIGTIIDQNPNMHLMQMLGKDYGCIPFHEDKLLLSGPSFGFFHYVTGCVSGYAEKNHRFTVESLIERPHLIFYFDEMKNYQALINYDFLKAAKLIVAESHTEEKTLQRDAPGCSTEVVYWTSGHTHDLQEMPDDAFLRFTGLSSQSYILQVGRFELRKNQLASVLATKDLDIPLVFIAMKPCNAMYEKRFLQAASHFRKGPTIVISQHLTKEDEQGSVQILTTPNGDILPKSWMLSAFFHAGLHLHPAFYELPGYTYLETARFGVPTIASSWGSLKDYFTDSSGQYVLDDRVSYALPYDIGALKNLVEKKFGKRYPIEPLAPIFKRKTVDVARDFLDALQAKF